jgi:hypothetical protein
MPDAVNTKLLTLAEIAQLAGVSQITIHRWVKAGVIQCLQPGGFRGKKLFLPDAITRSEGVKKTPNSKLTCPNSGPRPQWMKSGSTYSQGDS